MHPFNASNAPKTCLWCGRKLQPNRWEPSTLGPYRDGFFCTAGCARMFATCMADQGHRLTPLTESERKAHEERIRVKAERAAATMAEYKARNTGGTP